MPRESDSVPSSCWADFEGRVVGVIDGDTIEVLFGTPEADSGLQPPRPVKVRLVDIDCPEKGQPFGLKAKQTTAALCFGQTVRVVSRRRDRFERLLGEVVLPDGRILNEELIRLGYAWWFERYSKKQSLKELESAARVAKLGLWLDVAPIPPWDWRKKSRVP